MHFPVGSATRLRPSAGGTPDDEPPLPSSLAGLAKLGGAREETLVDLQSNGPEGGDGLLFALLGQSELTIWSVRPAVLLAKLRRSPLSLRVHGVNARVYWRPGGLLVQTSRDRLLLYALESSLGNPLVYRMPLGKPEKTPFAQTACEDELRSVQLRQEGELDCAAEGVGAVCATGDDLVLATLRPCAVYRLPWEALATGPSQPLASLSSAHPGVSVDWLIDRDASITSIVRSAALDIFALVTSDGRAYVARHGEDGWTGVCIHGPSDPSTPQAASTPRMAQPELLVPESPRHAVIASPAASSSALPLPLNGHVRSGASLPDTAHARVVAINPRFSLVAVGLADGSCAVHSLASDALQVQLTHVNLLRRALNSTAPNLATGAVTCATWSADGHALAIGWERGWSVWTVYGRLTCHSAGEATDLSPTFEDHFMQGISRAFWNPADLALFVLCPPPPSARDKIIDEQLFSIPFAKSAVATVHSPDNTSHACLLLDDRLLVYRGADQPDMSVINPESDVWQHIKIPADYVYNNWPIRGACISADARLIVVAGRRGLTHYNALSGRWKLFEDEAHEQAFEVRGGMQWYGAMLIVGCESNSGAHSIRVYARDKPLSHAYVVHEEPFPSAVVMLSIFDQSLLVYTADNTLHHLLIAPGAGGRSLNLRVCGGIGFEGVVRDPYRVRGLSWLVPRSQQRFGDPADDLNVATIIFLIDGKLVLLRPRRAGQDEVKYDMQVLADRIEFYWTHLSGIGTLENSLWGYDGRTIRIWLNALTIETASGKGALQLVQESVAIKPDFYPLCVLMDKGVVVGVDLETSVRKSLDFVLFRMITNTHLFLHHILRFHLSRAQLQEAVVFATHYQHLVYFAHALEILLHTVLELEADALLATRPSTPLYGANGTIASPTTPAPVDAVLPRIIAFLDHFDEALQVVVGCARKTEIARWAYLFEAVGKPRDLFEKCMQAGNLKVAASYLLVLHNLESLEQSSEDTIRLLKASMAAQDWALSKELLRFLYSLDHTGAILSQALSEADALPRGFMSPKPPRDQAVSAPTALLSGLGFGAAGDVADDPDGSPVQQRPERALASPPPRAVSPSSYGLGLGSLLSRVGLGQQPLARPSSR